MAAIAQLVGGLRARSAKHSTPVLGALSSVLACIQTDCYLRQGDGGTKLHVLVSKLAFVVIS